MTPCLLCCAALALDALLGDPPDLPHPVNLIGRLIRRLDQRIDRRRSDRYQRLAGWIQAIAVPLFCGTVAYSAVRLTTELFFPAGLALALYGLQAAFAGRCLATETAKVARALDECDLEKARRAVGMLVGRDTTRLNESEIAAAAVETLAENTGDGLIAPLFWALIGGLTAGTSGALAAAWAYKAINTADSLMGYRNERYLHAGRGAALTDDWANLIPARITAFLFCLWGTLTGRPAGWRAWHRDGHKHLSPNAGQAEAAVAGLLNLQLGGGHFYFGTWVDKPILWPEGESPVGPDIRRAIRLLMGVELLCVLILLTSAYLGG